MEKISLDDLIKEATIADSRIYTQKIERKFGGVYNTGAFAPVGA